MHEQDSAFAFEGNWREFAPIALTNLLLTIVTLGFYRFWATTRERRYLWSQTRFIDERLEWTGTGKELFVGFVVVVGLLIVPLLFIQFGLQAMMLRGHEIAAIILMLGIYVFFLYLFGLARFRALRYRLSRSWWRGIRGGSDDQGFGYGWSAVWKQAVGFLAAGLMIPWAMCSLWNERWGKMSFGGYEFSADADFGKIMWRYILCYAAPFIVIFGGLITMIPVIMTMGAGGGEPGAGAMVTAFAFIAAIYLIFPLIILAYYAAFMREAVGSLHLTTLDFEFTARTKDWIKLFLGNIGLVIVTLGVGIAFLGYRNWSFFIRHMEASGEIDVAALTQSTTRMPAQGEGLLDALDVGAI